MLRRYPAAGHRTESVLRYRGILEIDTTERGGGLPVELDLTRRALTVSSDGEVLGDYPLGEVAVSRIGSDRFDLRVGSDQLLFTADDAIRFSYEAMPMIESVQRDLAVHRVDRLREWWRARTSVVAEPSAAPIEAERLVGETPAGRAFTASETSVSLAEVRSRIGATRGSAAATDVSTIERPESPPPIPRSMSSQDVATATPSPDPEPGLTCMGIRSDGKICGSAAISERGFCYAHDPDRHMERRDVHDKTTRAADRVRRTAAQNLNDVAARLERAVAEVHEGKLDPQQALAMASLAQALVDTIELAKSEEAGKQPT